MNTSLNRRITPKALVVAVSAALLASASLQAIEIEYDGFIRTEMAVKAEGDENFFNERGNQFNGVTVNRLGVNLATGELVPDTVTRSIPEADNDFNMLMLRGELGIDARFTNKFSLRVQARAVFDPDWYSNFSPLQSPGSLPAGTLQQNPNLFEYRVNSGSRLQAQKSPNALEISGDRYLIDFPSLYLDYQDGPLNLRIGNQQIAWGQSLFFRVLDVPNGLDFRRHSLLDYVPEEFSDKRIPSPAVRASYALGQWDLDSFVQHFRPNILGNPNTPYNVIPAQFTVHDRYDKYDDKFNFGARVRGPLGPFQVQLMAARRYGPEGTFRWTASGVDRDIPGLPGTGQILAQTAFEVSPTGVVSAQEWYTYAALARLDAREGLNSAITDFPATALLGAVPAGSDIEAQILLDTFFQLSGGLRGHIAREYHKEETVGGGISYVFSGKQGGFLDQLIANVEVQYAKDRTFTNPTLGQNFLVDDEWTMSVVLEKYHRFSTEFPATYFVLQGLRKTKSDIFGRHLSGMGGDAGSAALDTNSPDSANYVAFALQQAFPNLVWRVDASVLYDVEGGMQSQVGLRWRPSGAWTVEAFYTRVDGNIRNRNRNLNALSTVSWSDEVTMRIGYQF